MIKKIISGGQTGADLAALDLAIKLGIEHGGWIPKGRKTEAGPLPESYRLKEMETDDYRERTRQNIIDSHGTVILSRGELTGGSKLTLSYAKVIGRPNTFINLSFTEEYEASLILSGFIRENRIECLNVAGPRISHQPWIYQDVKTVLEVALYQLYSESDLEKTMTSFIPQAPDGEEYPETVEQAVGIVCEKLPLKTRAFIAKTPLHQVYALYFSFQDYIKQQVGLAGGNKVLQNDCSTRLKLEYSAGIEDCVMLILRSVKQYLETDHLPRVIK